MTPEQIALIAALFGLAGITIAAAGKLVNWFPEYVQKVATQKIEEKAQELDLEKKLSETELLERQNEAESKRRQDLALAETVERLIALYTQSQDIHAKESARSTDVQERSIEVQAKLLTAIDTQTRALTTSQSWQEKRSEDTLAGIDLLGERTAGLVAVTNDTHVKVDTITGGLEQVKQRLDTLLIEVVRISPNTEALQRLETEITNLIVLVKPLRDAIFRDANTVISPPENLIDTKELTAEDMLAATRVFPDESETENPTKLSNEPDSQPNLPKASGL
jgi:hypothetical protein